MIGLTWRLDGPPIDDIPGLWLWAYVRGEGPDTIICSVFGCGLEVPSIGLYWFFARNFVLKSGVFVMRVWFDIGF